MSASDWITLDVGGKKMSTTRSTLTSCPDSVLARMFNPDSGLQPARMVDGVYKLDSDPNYFEVILNWLRHRQLIIPNHLTPDGVAVVAEYYGLQDIVEQLRGVQTQSPLMLSGNWSKTFPAKVETESKSLTFVKKLLTVAISNITYLRSMFPEEAYANRSLDGLSLKVLRAKNNCDEAKTLAGWLIGAFEALEKKYLRELMLVVYLDPANPDQVHEMYTFSFSYLEGEATCQVLQGKDRREVQTVQADDIYNATQHLLRTLVNFTQSLGPLPNSTYLAMKLTYYDEVTPNDYEPAGFHPTELVEHQVAGGTEVKVGEVTTSQNVVKLKVQAVFRQQSNSQQAVEVPKPIDLQYSQTDSVPGPADQKVTDGGDRTPDKEILSQDLDTRPSQRYKKSSRSERGVSVK